MSTQNHTQSQERDSATIWMPPEAQGKVPGRGRLQGRRILVVGAGTQATDESNPPVGNGRAIAILCAREGATVACADMDAAAARDTLTMIEKDGGRGTTIVANVAEPEACE